MTVLQRGAQCLEAGDVSGELENPEDPENPEDLGGLGQVVQGVVGVDAVKAQGEEEGQDAQQVDHVQEGEQELPLEKISAVKKCIFLTFFGETVKRMMYSRVNQTTKVVSAIWKKSLSSCWLLSSVCCEIIFSSKIKMRNCLIYCIVE